MESYIQELIKAKDDSSKMKWAWGVITAARQITEIKAARKEKSFLCSKCKLYLEPRRRLAELVIQGCRCYKSLVKFLQEGCFGISRILGDNILATL
jgi:hypothetical protein